jgi:CO/xanthine dehydrogenase Mo-binding subunit
MMGNAVKLAAAALRRRLLALAADRLESAVGDLELRDGFAAVVGVPDRRVALAELVLGVGAPELSEVAEFRNEGGLDPETGQGIASSHWHQGAGAVEVEVDRETGQVTILKAHSAVYAGQVANRPTAELQAFGNIVFGIGSALCEEICFDGGQVVNPNLSDYLIPSFLDLPAALTFDLLERPGADMHGLGETALPTIPAAVGNAVAQAIGARIRALPLTPERVLRAMEGGDLTPVPSSLTPPLCRSGDGAGGELA